MRAPRIAVFLLLAFVSLFASGCRCLSYCLGGGDDGGTPPPSTREGVVEIQRVGGTNPGLVGYVIFDPEYENRVWWVVRSTEVVLPDAPAPGPSGGHLTWTMISPYSPDEMKGPQRLSNAEIANALCGSPMLGQQVAPAKVIDSNLFLYSTLICP